MILPDWQITAWARAGGVDPFVPEQVNPASYDLRIAGDIIWLSSPSGVFSAFKSLQGGTFVPGDAILVTTIEYVKIPPTLAAAVYLKSTLARQGLDHALAGFVDPGFEGQLTLLLHFHHKLTLKPGQRICQLVLWQMTATPDKPYQGRYQGQRGATKAILMQGEHLK